VLAVAGLAAFGAGVVAGWLLLRRVRRRVGPSWEDWRHAEQIGGRWAPVIYGATLVLGIVVVAGFFLPGGLRAGIAGAVLGLCVPFFAEGLRRRHAARNVP
jgi:hypothetical protein